MSLNQDLNSSFIEINMTFSEANHHSLKDLGTIFVPFPKLEFIY
jgi:hypothetical protein